LRRLVVQILRCPVRAFLEFGWIDTFKVSRRRSNL
jgi:hypothetical protein